MYCEKYKDDREKLLEEVQRKEDIEINLRYLLNPEQRSNNRAALVKYLENTGLMNRIFYFFSHTTTQHNIHSKQNNRHTLHVLKVQSKGRERGRDKVTTKQVLPLYNHIC